GSRSCARPAGRCRSRRRGGTVYGPLCRARSRARGRARGGPAGGAAGGSGPIDERGGLHGGLGAGHRERDLPAGRAQLRDPGGGGAVPRGMRRRAPVLAGRPRGRRGAAQPHRGRLQRVRVRRDVRASREPERDAWNTGAHMTTGIEAQVLQPYKYGFVTDIEADVVPPGLNEDVIRLISAKKGEPEWMLDWRLRAYHNWLKMPEPHWANVRYGPIDYQAISYYAAPKAKPKLRPGRQWTPNLTR